MTTRNLKKVDRAEIEMDVETTGRVVSSLVLRGDISALSAEERSKYYVQMCESLGLNPAAQPFSILKLNGKEILYPTRGATDQLASIHKINREIVDGPKVVDLAGTKLVFAVCRATHPNGRIETAVATLPLADPVNVLMKCECVPLDSEILTRDGWKLHHQVVVGDEVLAYDTEKDQCRWTPLTGVSVFENVPVSELHSPERQFSVRCTPNHKWAVRKPSYRPRGIEGGRGVRGAYANRRPDVQLVEAWDLNTTHRLVLSAAECETEEGLLEPAEAAVLGWMVTDGTHQKRGTFERIGICQSKEENYGIIRETVAQAAGAAVHEVVSAPRTRTFPTGRTCDTLAQHWWYLPAEVSRSIFKKAGYASRADLPKIVTRLAPKARAAMLQAMMLAEADERDPFANGDRHVLDAFEILAALQGKATGSTKAHGPISEKRLKTTRHVACGSLSLDESGTSDVWCPTTKFGTWVMRQNGRVMITGNTKAKRRATLSILGLGMLDETELDTIPAHSKEPARPIDLPDGGRVGEEHAVSNTARAAMAATHGAIEKEAAHAEEMEPALAKFMTDLEQIELPGEAVDVWLKHRSEIFVMSDPDKEAAWRSLCRRTEDVGKMKNAKTWLNRAIREEEIRRARPENSTQPAT